MMKLELEQVQALVYSIFQEFDRVCRKYDIHYTMEGGTLLGAVKYGGFVPWDDDIDVVMKRPEYEKFLAVAPGELGEKFFLQSYHNVPEFPLHYAKLCLNGTEHLNYTYSGLKNMHHGLFMDIFPIDEVYPEKLRRHTTSVGVLFGTRRVKLEGFKASGIRKLVYGALALLPIKTINKMVDRRCKRYNGKNTGYFYEVCNPNRRFPAMPREIYDETIRIPFRDGEFEASKHYDKFLKSRFGENYMQDLPPEEKRKPSHGLDVRMT